MSIHGSKNVPAPVGRQHAGQAQGSARKRNRRRVRLASEAAEAQELGLTVAELRLHKHHEAQAIRRDSAMYQQRFGENNPGRSRYW